MSKQSRAEYQRQYRLAHQESIANQNSQYRLAHQESIANQNSQYRLAHQESVANQKSQYRVDHAAEISQYRVDHAANIKESNASYYSKKRKQQKLSQGSNDTLNESFFSDLTDSRNNSFAHSGSGLFAVDDSDDALHDASLEPNHGLLFLLGDELSAITPYDMSQPSRAGDVPLEKRLLDSNLKDARKLPAKSATKLAKDAEIKQRGEDRAQLVEALAMACNGEVPSVAFDKQPSIRNAAKDFVDRVYGIVLHTCGVCSERRYLDAGHMDVTGVFTCRRCETEEKKESTQKVEAACAAGIEQNNDPFVASMGRDNDMDPYFHSDPTAVLELEELLLNYPLTLAEQASISMTTPIMNIMMLKSGMMAFKGHTVAVLQDVQSVCYTLPRAPHDAAILKLRRTSIGNEGKTGTYKDFIIRKYILYCETADNTQLLS